MMVNPTPNDGCQHSQGGALVGSGGRGDPNDVFWQLGSAAVQWSSAHRLRDDHSCLARGRHAPPSGPLFGVLLMLRCSRERKRFSLSVITRSP